MNKHWIFSLTDKCLYRHRAYTGIQIKQASITDDAYGPIHKLSPRTKRATTSVPLATKAKKDIIQAMKLINDVEGLTIGLPPQVGASGADKESATATTTKSATEIILASHLATELFDMEQERKAPGGGGSASRVVATTLSRYYFYLVAHTPELLPDDEVWVSERLKGMRTCLAANVLPKNCCNRGCYMLCTPCRCCKDTSMPDSLRRNQDDLDDSTTRDGVELLDKIQGWDELPSFWVRLLVYLAPSNDVQGHARAVASSGGDLISCLWAFCTHAGITRQN